MAGEAERLICGDVGGTKTAFGVVGPEGVEEGTQRRFETPLRNLDGFLTQMGGTILELANKHDLDTAVVGFNGPAFNVGARRYVGPLASINQEGDGTFDVAQRLHQAVPDLEGLNVLALNDAEAAAYAAVKYARGDGLLLFINQGTGIGGDAICPKGLSSRKHGYLGEYGEAPVEVEEGEWVTWGSLISGKGIQRRYGAVEGSDRQRTAAELYEDPEKDWIWPIVGRHFVKGLTPLLASIGPTDLVIGGSVSQCSPKYGPALEEGLQTAFGCLSDDCSTKIPYITYVPPADLPTLPLEGAYKAYDSRRADVVRVGGPRPLPIPPLQIQL
jgi:predicted NBD/HSP70 family sugar kinase